MNTNEYENISSIPNIVITDKASPLSDIRYMRSTTQINQWTRPVITISNLIRAEMEDQINAMVEKAAKEGSKIHQRFKRIPFIGKSIATSTKATKNYL